MLRNDFHDTETMSYEELCALSDQLEQAGQQLAAEDINFRIQELDFEMHPELSQPEPWAPYHA